MKTPTVFDLCQPRKEVLEGRVSDDQFAADLAAVLEGTAAPENYRDPGRFFDNTYPTRGLKNLLESICGRLSGAAADAPPIFRLDTSYGGGKTHGLIALVHAARASSQVPGDFLPATHRPTRPVRIAAFDGENADPANGRDVRGVSAKTPWGEIAVQLAGRPGFERVRQSEEEGTAPGAETIRALFGGEPALILLDELAVYLRKVKGRLGAAGQLTAFLTGLFKAVETEPQAALVFTLAIGKDGATDAYAEEHRWLSELQSVSARKATLLNPTEEDETAPVLHRRLFERIDESGVEEVVAAYRKVWKAHPGREELSEVARTPETVEHFRAAYPFHPELLDTLTRKTSTLADFQRVRGMLRLLTRTIAHLWNERPADATAIHLHDVPVGISENRRELLTRLGQGTLESALDSDVEGPKGPSLAQRLDAEHHSGRPPYALYAARAIFLHSFAFNEGLKGCSPRRLRYSMVGPATDFAFIEEARKLFREKSAYLDDRPGAPLRFHAEANLNKILSEHEGTVDAEEVRAELRDRIQRIFGGKNRDLEPVFFPGGPSDVPDDPSDRPRLVVISPDAVEIRGDDDAAPEAIQRIHQRKGGEEKSLRRRRNHLVFLAPDSGRKNKMRERAVRLLALRSLKKPEHLDNLADHQQAKVKEWAQGAEQEVALAVHQCYRRLFYPATGLQPGRGDLAHAVLDDPASSEKPGNGQRAVVRHLREDAEKLRLPEDQPDAPDYVRDKTPLKTKGEMTTADLRDEFRCVPALPMLIGDQVFRRGVVLGVEQGRFAYRSGDLLFGPGDPEAVITVDDESRVATIQYAKNRGFWPRKPPPPPEPPKLPGLSPGPAPTPPGPGPTPPGPAPTRPGPAPPYPPPTPEPTPTAFLAEAPMREALTRLAEWAGTNAPNGLASISIRPQEPTDGFRLIRGANNPTVPGAKTAAMEGNYETAGGGAYCLQEFAGPLADAAPVADFLDQQFRDAASTDLTAIVTLTFPEGAPAGAAWDKLANQLTRFVGGQAVVKAAARK